MLDPAPNSHNALASTIADRNLREDEPVDRERDKNKSGDGIVGLASAEKRTRRALPKNSFLKRLDTLYWRRLFRYFYVRFLRMRSSPEAIARGMAAGVFAGSFPLMGLQIIIGVAIAAIVRGNKAIAAASTWISNPLTYVPLFWLNFQIGRWLLRFPPTTELSIGSSSWHWNTFMSMGVQVFFSLMVGSLVVGLAASVVGYFLGLAIAQRVQHVQYRKKSQKKPQKKL